MTGPDAGTNPAFWRVFPWNPETDPGAPFSASYIPAVQGSGRFDLSTSRVLYLAETPEHAVGEAIQGYRGRRLTPGHLRKFGCSLALIAVTVPERAVHSLADLTDPAELASHAIRPDQLAGRDTRRTQSISRSLHTSGVPGFRWWSSLSGDWHTMILFLDRVDITSLQFSTPDTLSLEHPAVRNAAEVLGVRIRHT